MASKRNFRRKSCKNKQRYGDHAVALQSMFDLQRKFKSRLQVYHCRFCGGYHISHHDPTDPRRNMDELYKKI